MVAVLVSAVEVDGDLLAGCGAAPDVDGHVALEDHVAGEDFGEGDFRVSQTGSENENDKKEARH